MKLLIADDSDAKIMMLEGMTNKAQFPAEILIAKTTEEAIALIHKHPDIAFGLIDYEIPSAQGPVVISALKKKNPKSHVVLCSAYCKDQYVEEALSAGAEAAICTSEGMEEMEEEMEELLQTWKQKIENGHVQ